MSRFIKFNDGYINADLVTHVLDIQTLDSKARGDTYEDRYNGEKFYRIIFYLGEDKMIFETGHIGEARDFINKILGR